MLGNKGVKDSMDSRKNKGALLYAIVGVCTLVIAVIGATYAYYQASATASISGAAGGGAPTLTVTKLSTSATGDLIPIDMDTTTLTNAAKGWTGSAVGSSWNASYACKDKNGYSVCQIYSVTVKNNASNAQNFNIGVTALSGANTPNIDVVKMASNISVTSDTSIKGDASGIASNISVGAGATSSTYYFMVIIKNLNNAQTDNGLFSGTVTAVSTAGAEVKASFGEISFTVNGQTFTAVEGMTWNEFINSSYNTNYEFSIFGGTQIAYINRYILYEVDDVDSLIINGKSYYSYDMCCFDAGSQVLMANNTTKNIEDVKVGDYVMSYDTKTGNYSPQRVTNTIVKHNSDDLVYLNLSNGVRIGMRAYHPMLTVNGWKSLRPELAETISDVGHIQQLGNNDTLIGYNNVSITSIEQREPIDNYDTYNFTVDNFHTYIVNGVVVHNANCPD